MTPTVDVAEWINRQRISRLQYVVMALCAACAMLEGFDALNIGFVAPAIVREWHLPPQSFTPAFMAGLFGLLLGCLFVAPLADKVGRRTVMIGSVVAFGVFSLASATAGSLSTLSLLRFLTGLGVGGGVPNAIALTSEYFPERSRAGMTAVMFVGFPLGSSLGGFLSGWLIPAFGWPSVFIAGGVLPLLVAPALLIALPESIRHLVVSGATAGRIATVLARIAPGASFAAATRFVIGEEHKPGLTVAHLFREGRALGTMLLWVVFFMSLLDIFLISSWLPILLHEAGLSLATAVDVQATLALSGVVAVLATAPILNRSGYFIVLLPAYLLSAISNAAFGTVGTDLGMVLLCAATLGAGNVAGQNTANALAAAFYPTYIRATGIGWALGVGRAGAVLGPAIGGTVLAFHLGASALFMVAAVPPLISIAALLVLMRLVPARTTPRRAVPAVQL
jgi:MFS transporter, AAHS family, 4-hydroxybenzoate transporter